MDKQSQVEFLKIVKLWGFVLLLIGQMTLTAQDELVGYNHTYNAQIKSVKFHTAGLPLTMPILELNTRGSIILSFDDMEGGSKRYTYTIEHCDRKWDPSDLEEQEYIQGFQGEQIRQLDYSESTRHDYTHYELALPNSKISLLKSGNYLIHVFDDGSNPLPVITRRFYVVDTKLKPRIEFVKPINAKHQRSHQQFQLYINIKDVILSDPLQDIHVTILQNDRWDKAIEDVLPKYVQGEDLVFDIGHELVFPAGKEFRILDIRSLRFRSKQVEAVEEYNDGYVVFAEPESIRTYKNYFTEEDINGQFLIDNKEKPRASTSAEYVYCNFLLESESIDNQEIYWISDVNDWECKEDFRMKYNDNEGGYTGEFLLKQGIYNYIYATLDTETGYVDTQKLEGNWYETENEYTVLIYHRPFGARYDYLIGIQTFQSFKN